MSSASSSTAYHKRDQHKFKDLINDAIKPPNQRQTQTNKENSEGAYKLSKERVLSIFEKINLISTSRQFDMLAKICKLVSPFGFLDTQAFKFDLFALETSVIEQLEEILALPPQHSSVGKPANLTTTTATTNKSAKQQQQAKEIIKTNIIK